jgi:excisionase family DNA binding protein
MTAPTITIEESKSLPAMMVPEAWAKLTGQSLRYIQNCCKDGSIPAVRVGGGRWRILTRKALAQLGIDEL